MHYNADRYFTRRRRSPRRQGLRVAPGLDGPKVNVVSRHVTGHLHHPEVVVQHRCVVGPFPTTSGLIVRGNEELLMPQCGLYYSAEFLNAVFIVAHKFLREKRQLMLKSST